METMKTEDPVNCTKSYCDKICQNCDYINYEMVDHPGGVYAAPQVESYYCELEYWEDDF